MPVYVLGVVDGCHKIGRSANPAKRSGAWSSLPTAPQIVHTIATKNPRWLERYMHEVFADCRVNGEWFRLPAIDLQLIRHVVCLNDLESANRVFGSRMAESYAALERRSKAEWEAFRGGAPVIPLRETSVAFFTMDEAAARLRRSRSKVYELMRAGELAYIQSADGCHRFIPVAAIVEYLARRLRRN